VTVSLNDEAANLTVGLHHATVSFENLTDHDGDTSRQVRLRVGDPAPVHSYLLDSDPGWSTDGAWAFGQPLGGGGDFGGPDPTSGHTGLYVYGYNLAGDYGNEIPEHHLTSSAIDCSQLSAVSLKFWRWLGVEGNDYDHAMVSVSNDGSEFHTIWHNTMAVTDYAWILQEFDISHLADWQPTVYLRWTMGPTDASWCYCGWNLDDIEIWGLDSSAQPVYLNEFIVTQVGEIIDIHWSLGAACQPGEFRLQRLAGTDRTVIPHERTSECHYQASDRWDGSLPDQEVTYELLGKDGSNRWQLLTSKRISLANVPDWSRLLGVHPNPCNPSAEISFSLNRAQYVSLSVYDLRGRQVTVLADRMYRSGNHRVKWDGTDTDGAAVASGSYCVRLETASAVDSRLITLVR
jgi:hypothetical protein